MIFIRPPSIRIMGRSFGPILAICIRIIANPSGLRLLPHAQNRDFYPDSFNDFLTLRDFRGLLFFPSLRKRHRCQWSSKIVLHFHMYFCYAIQGRVEKLKHLWNCIVKKKEIIHKKKFRVSWRSVCEHRNIKTILKRNVQIQCQKECEHFPVRRLRATPLGLIIRGPESTVAAVSRISYNYVRWQLDIMACNILN